MIQWLSNTFFDAKKYGEYIRLAALQEEVTLQWFLDTFGSVTKINSHAKKIGSIRETMIDSTLDLNAKFEKVTKTLGIKKFISADDVEGTCTPQDFIQRILDKMEELEESKLYVGTIHSSKGLEYDTVYLMGVDDFSFQLGTEEMNNLYYVGVTRAKNHLVVFRR
jgi:superfamily I DNA/RNA helicase